MKGVQDLTTNKEYNKRLVQLLEGYEIKDLLNEMEKNSQFFMQLMNLANYVETDFETIINEDFLLNNLNCNKIESEKILKNIRKYGANYYKILEQLYVLNNNINNMDSNNIDCNNTILEADDKLNNDINDEAELDGNIDNNIEGNTEDIKITNYFFNNILFFTNDTDSKTNKTLKNLEDAIQYTDINLIKFDCDKVSYTATDKYISITDGKTKYKIKDQSNIDTICIVRLGAQDNEQCVECIKEIQE